MRARVLKSLKYQIFRREPPPPNTPNWRGAQPPCLPLKLLPSTSTDYLSTSHFWENPGTPPVKNSCIRPWYDIISHLCNESGHSVVFFYGQDTLLSHCPSRYTRNISVDVLGQPDKIQVGLAGDELASHPGGIAILLVTFCVSCEPLRSWILTY